MKYLLDTNAVIALLASDAALLQRLKRHLPADYAVSSIVMHELYFGAYRSRRVVENMERVDRLRFPVLDFDREDSRRAGQLRADLADIGTPIGPNDVLIAGQALARSMVVVTRNIGEFERVAGLRVESW